MIPKKIVVAITGASGSIYAKVLLDKLLACQHQLASVGVVMSDNAKDVWKFELGNDDYTKYPFAFYERNDFYAPFASGSAKFDTMIVCPCSMGTLARIAGGTSSDLTTRAADVMLKERRRLILVPRETPMSLIHLRNMQGVTEAGGIICPASPSFYSLPKNFEELAATVIDRVMELTGLESGGYEWGSTQFQK
ncbi:UbiX family flavin prenyltransferase [Parapedobacter defluvii]|uniref:UbiX family flavin prenyltransferase n=1 Tax=Parapedobacter defluvii TaxID=2045106 RepID=UPI0033425836